MNMTIQEVHEVLQNNYPHLRFKIVTNKKNNSQGIICHAYSDSQQIEFSAMFELSGMFIRIVYGFGQVKLDYETLEHINRFNFTSTSNYKAIIDYSNNQNFLVVVYYLPIIVPNQASKIFDRSKKQLFSNPEFLALYKCANEYKLLKSMS
ncbi:MAG: hypothetical protein MJ206_02260 [Bacilli bacterium]|nr:hypothetical protein [Bacilli bacterium]